MGLVGLPLTKMHKMPVRGVRGEARKSFHSLRLSGPHSCCLQEECQWDKLLVCEPQSAHSCLLVSLCPPKTIAKPMSEGWLPLPSDLSGGGHCQLDKFSHQLCSASD